MSTPIWTWKTLSVLDDTLLYELHLALSLMAEQYGELAFDDVGIHHPDFKMEHVDGRMRWTVTGSTRQPTKMLILGFPDANHPASVKVVR
jgi:hypothetical protein